MKTLTYKPPSDYLNPDWDDDLDWSGMVFEDLREIWDSFTDEQKAIIAANINCLYKIKLDSKYG